MGGRLSKHKSETQTRPADTDEADETEHKEVVPFDQIQGCCFPPLPGEVSFDLTFDIQKDLKALSTLCGRSLPPLLAQEWRRVSPDTEVSADSDKKTQDTATHGDCESKTETEMEGSGKVEIESGELSDESVASDGRHTDATVTIVQWNALADTLSNAYSTRDDSPFAFTHGVDSAHLRWTFRGVRIIERIVSLSPDILCVEECDFDDFIANYLEPLGYELYFQKKESSPTKFVAGSIAAERGLSRLDVESDGVCIAVKKAAFECLEVYKSPPTYGLFVRVRHSATGKQFVVCSTHLCAKPTRLVERVRVSQMRDLIGRKFTKRFGSEMPLVVCCDLNATATDTVKIRAECYRLCTGELALRSAYATLPLYTINCVRGFGPDKKCIDFIFTRNVLCKDTDKAADSSLKATVTHTLSIPGIDASGEVTADYKIPSDKYPSDHFAIGVKLLL